MVKLAFVDFEANGFPDEDGTFRACLTYIQKTKVGFAKIFKELDPSFQLQDWKIDTDDISDTDVIENTFTKIWSVYKENQLWKNKLLEKALQSHDTNKNWRILTVTNTTKTTVPTVKNKISGTEIQETESTDHYLCYQNDIDHMDSIVQQYTIDKTDTSETVVDLEFIKFDHTNSVHRDVILSTVFATTVLSCAILHVTQDKGKIKIETDTSYEKSQSKTESCYYQKYKQDEHYVHSMSAQRIHNLKFDHLQEQGISLEHVIDEFWKLRKSVFVAHNASADQRFLLNTIEKYIKFYKYKSILYPNEYTTHVKVLQKLLEIVQKPWTCTLKRARETYKKQIPNENDVVAENDERELEDYTLQNLYEFITKTSMPKRHDAQMDVYACATIYFDTCNPKPENTSALKELISKIVSDQIVCVKPIDFWRYALLPQYKNYLNNPESKQTREAKKWISETRNSNQIAPISFTDVNSEWSWCLKYDGFYVRLQRDSTNKWKIYSRRGIEYHPPTSFLQHLTTEFPEGVEIEAELVSDTNQMCLEQDREDVQRRIVKRTKDFDKLHVSALRSKEDMTAWNGLRLVLFAFVWEGRTFEDSFEDGTKIIENSKEKHPHISTCVYETVSSTPEAIEIFKSVVQMGLEGVVLRKKTTLYSKNPITDDSQHSIYKMKQKVVTDHPQQFIFKRQVKRAREGGVRAENEYEVPAFQAKNEVPRKCTFTDAGESGEQDQNNFYTKRLKWHEQAPSKMNVWDLNNLGMRHTCFATNLDLSFEVEPNKHPSKEETVKRVLTQTQPFSFIVETVYLFLDMIVYTPSVWENKTNENKLTKEVQLGQEHVLDIGMLKFTGKTGETIKAQKFHHKKYIRSYTEEQQKEVGSTSELFQILMLFLHHIPYDNKKFVFVVDGNNVFQTFKDLREKLINLKNLELTKLKIEAFNTEAIENERQELIAKKEMENGFFKGIVNRIEKNKKARQQQVEVVFMQEYRKDEKIGWGNDVAGRIPSITTNANSFYALLSRELSEEEFEKYAKQQFDTYVTLQKLWNFTDKSEADRLKINKVCRLNALPTPFVENIIYLDLVFDMKAPISEMVTKQYQNEHDKKKEMRKDFYDEIKKKYADNYRVEIKTLYKKLEKYSKENDGRRFITFTDFLNIFHPAREIEKVCPNDPATGNFPYRTATDINRWHRAWHMSYAFFKNKEMSVDWTVPAEPVPENGDPVQQPAVSVQSREPTPSPSRPQPAAQPPHIPEVVNLIDSAPTSPAREQQPPQIPQVVDLTDSPPTSPARISDRQQERDPKKPRLSTPNHTHDQPSSSSQDSTSVQGDAERNQAPSPDAPMVISDVEDPQTSNEVHAPQGDNPDEIMSDDEQSPILLHEPSKAVDEMETDDEQSPILSFKPSTTVVDAMKSDDEPSTEKNDEEDENEEVNDEEDEMNEEEQDEAGMSPKEDRPSASDWVNAEVEADKKAEKKRRRAERKNGPRPSAKEWIERSDEDSGPDAKPTDEELKEWSEKIDYIDSSKMIYISTLLRQLKIYSTE